VNYARGQAPRSSPQKEINSQSIYCLRSIVLFVTPEPEEVMDTVESEYNLDCYLAVDTVVDSVSAEVDFVVEEVPPDVALDIAKFVSVRGYQAYLGEIDTSQSANIPIGRDGESL